MKLIPDIFEDFLTGLNWVAPVWSAIYDGSTTTTISLYNILHLRSGLFVEINSAQVEVQSVDYDNNSFVVNGDQSGISEVTLPVPKYFHGTQLATNAKISKLDDNAKVPMIWLHEVIREDLGDFRSIATTASLRLFFLDVANYQDWTTDEHYAKVIRPMTNLRDYVLQEMRGNGKKFRSVDSATSYAHVKFGQVTDRGHFQSVFNAKLSGVELVVDVQARECQPNRGIVGRQPTELKGGEGFEMEMEFDLVA